MHHPRTSDAMGMPDGSHHVASQPKFGIPRIEGQLKQPSLDICLTLCQIKPRL